MESHEKDLRSAVESDEQRRAVQDDYHVAGLAAREVALLDYAVKLTREPRAVGRSDLDALRAVGYSDEQLVDAVQCIGYFNFINRVLDGLGVDPEPGMRYGEAVLGIEELKKRLKTTWMAGDFGVIARSYESGAADFIRRLGLMPGKRVLDVACGTGNLAIPAGRTGAEVSGVDIAVNLLDQARARAAVEKLTIQFDEGDAEKLPYPDTSFDVVVSMFGVIFAPQPPLAAAELLRVCRPGGTIALATWIPAGFVGQMFQAIARHVPPPTSSPLLWGDDAMVREWLAGGCAELQTTRRTMAFEFSIPPAEVVDLWRAYYGPTNRAFAALADAPAKQTALRADLERLWMGHNQALAGSTRVEAEYLEVIASKSCNSAG